MKVKQFFIKVFKRIKSNLGVKSLIFLGVFIVLLVADLVLKYCEELYEWDFTVIPGVIFVEHGHRNPGAGFSWLADKAWGQTFLIVLTFIMIAAIVLAILALPERFTLLKLSLYIILAGAIGNLVDRLMFGEVRDFVWLVIVNAYCNFADFWIVIGGIMAILDMLFFNEWAVLPLTKRARAAQAEHRKREEAKKAAQFNASGSSAVTEENVSDIQKGKTSSDGVPSDECESDGNSAISQSDGKKCSDDVDAGGRHSDTQSEKGGNGSGGDE